VTGPLPGPMAFLAQSVPPLGLLPLIACGLDCVSKRRRRAAHVSTVLAFPARRSVVIRIIRDDEAWLVLARDHGWVYGSQDGARRDAEWLSRNMGLPVLEVAA
jgi:hypothetical protein